MFKNFRFIGLALLLILSFALIACGGDDSDEGADTEDTDTEETEDTDSGDADGEDLEIGQEDLKQPYVAWARESISTEMLAQLLEMVGYNVETSQVEAGPMFSSVADGSADFHTSAWLPATHQSDWEEYEGDIVKVNEKIDKEP